MSLLLFLACSSKTSPVDLPPPPTTDSSLSRDSQPSARDSSPDTDHDSGSAPSSDGDGDGWTEEEGDCRDDDPAIHPGAEEIWYDGVDQDCDGNDQDQDGDGIPQRWDLDDEDPQRSIEWEEVEIEAGTFMMGCTPVQKMDCSDMEQPVHEVTLTRDFVMMTTEVTQSTYGGLMDEDPSIQPECGNSCPADSLSWGQAVALANALSDWEGRERCYEVDKDGKVSWDSMDCEGWRLPTEAEWEYAARAGLDERFAGSDDLNEVGWYDQNSEGSKQPVGQLEPNDWGLYDMSGNLCEWAWDFHSVTWYEVSPSVDPLGPDDNGQDHVVRGGSWFNEAHDARVTNRNYSHGPHHTSSNIGARLVRTVSAR